MTESRYQEVGMIASVESFVGRCLETIWAVGASVLAAFLAYSSHYISTRTASPLTVHSDCK